MAVSLKVSKKLSLLVDNPPPFRQSFFLESLCLLLVAHEAGSSDDGRGNAIVDKEILRILL